ncbi:hypothetical protein ACQEVF_50375 [Nonomuraea polychroma]|uniref:hypothetical protein n=1 Tax=Nonomuraea polychroma TaxID=46176 RepID=UPI003D911380
MVALFEAVWERSVPVRLTGSGAEPSPEGADLSRDEERLLTLLASGATDKAAARPLRCRPRASTAALGIMFGCPVAQPSRRPANRSSS